MSADESSVGEVSTDTRLVVGLVGGAEFVNHMYLVLFPPILDILATEFDVTISMLGIAIGVQGLTNAIFQLPFGYISDRYDRVMALGLSLSISTASVFLIAIAPTFEVLLMGQALLGIGIAGHHPIHFPLLASATPEHLRARAFSIRGFLGSLGFAAPPTVVIAIISLPDSSWRHAVGLIGSFGAIYGVVMLFVLTRYVDSVVTKPTARKDHDQRPLHRGVSQEIRGILRSPAILSLAVLALASSIVSWGVTTYAVVLLQNGYGVSFNNANLTLSAMFIVGAVAVLIGGDLSDRFSPAPVLTGSYSLVTVFLVLLASLVVPSIVAIACLLVVGGLRAIGGPARSRLADLLSTRNDLGRNFAIVTVGTMTGTAIAPPLFGTLIDEAGLSATFLVLSSSGFLAVLITLLVVRTYTPSGGQAALSQGTD